jgi:hypothetical protein
MRICMKRPFLRDNPTFSIRQWVSLILLVWLRYGWGVRCYGTRGTLSDWSSPSRFCTGESGLDRDGNGIPDDQEVGMSIDLDNNAIADAEQDDLRCVNVLEGDAQMAGLFRPCRLRS